MSSPKQRLSHPPRMLRSGFWTLAPQLVLVHHKQPVACTEVLCSVPRDSRRRPLNVERGKLLKLPPVLRHQQLVKGCNWDGFGGSNGSPSVVACFFFILTELKNSETNDTKKTYRVKLLIGFSPYQSTGSEVDKYLIRRGRNFRVDGPLNKEPTVLQSRDFPHLFFPEQPCRTTMLWMKTTRWG